MRKPLCRCEIQPCLKAITSPEFQDCFWAWALARSDAFGAMTPLSQSEIIRLLKIPSSKGTTRIKDAREELRILLISIQAQDW